MPKPAVMFDLDGTLADTSGDLIAAANSCFRGLGLGDLLDASIDAATALRGGRAMLRLGFSRVGGFGETEVDQQYPILLNAYETAIDTHTVLYPGAMDAVKRLSSSGYAVGIATNKPEGLAHILLTSLGVRGAFASLIGADTLPIKKPDPEHHYEAVRRAGGDVTRSLLVGDTVTDRDTARNAGVPSILVDFAQNSEKIALLEPDAMISHYDELFDLVYDLIGPPAT